jgi:DNA-binding NarL/FixJ family response regulator
MISVFVIASTPMMQAGLRAMLTSTDIAVVGEAAEATALIEELADIDVVVVADTMLLENVARTLASYSTVALVVLANNARAEYPGMPGGSASPLQILRSLELRSWGIAPLDAPAAQLQAAVRATAQGLIVLPTPRSSWLYEKFSLVEAANLTLSDESLTNREREVLELVSQGLSNKLIARKLSISEHTVKFHISSISTKLGASSRTDAVSRGLRRGLITL